MGPHDAGPSQMSKVQTTTGKNRTKKPPTFLIRFIEQTDHRHVAARQKMHEVTTELCRESVFNDTDSVTSEVIRSTLERAGDTTPGPDGIRFNDINELSDGDIEDLA